MRNYFCRVAVPRPSYFSFVALFWVAGLCCLQSQASGQGKKDSTVAVADSLPYQKYPKLPAFNILLTDSTTIFNTFNTASGRPTAIVFFDPDCSHCQSVTRRLLDGMDSLKNIRFYFISSVHSMAGIRKFKADYHFDDYKNIEVIGRDYEFFFVSYYGVTFVPDIALYDGKKKFVKLWQGTALVDELYKYTH